MLVDLEMPGMDGWEVCRRLKSHQQTASIPIIILTANDGEDLEDRAMRIGALELLRKPCAADLLGERIAAVVRRPVARFPNASGSGRIGTGPASGSLKRTRIDRQEDD